MVIDDKKSQVLQMATDDKKSQRLQITTHYLTPVLKYMILYYCTNLVYICFKECMEISQKKKQKKP